MKRITLILSFFLWLSITAANAQIQRFEHIIVVVQENRTPDNLFQGLCVPPYGSSDSCSTTPGPNQYNIQTTNWLDSASATGVIQPAPVALANNYDLSHKHSAFVAQCDSRSSPTRRCKMDGGANVACSGNCLSDPTFRYVDNSSGIVNPYLDIATQYGWANYMFQTNQGPSFPAHQFIFGGTSAPGPDEDHNGVFASENVVFSIAGCAALRGATVQLIRPPGVENPTDVIFPCFEHQTMGDFQQAFSWKYYAPNANSIWTAPNAVQHICQSSGYGGRCEGQAWIDNVDLTPADVLTDISQCHLRGVSWVMPTGANSDHANGNDGGGPSWVASIVNAVGTSTACDDGNGYWKNTAIFITWDDWGGWYDHEPPPVMSAPGGDYQYGFRVPLLVVSAYTPTRYVDTLRYDFGSILRFIEQNFGLSEGALTFADARAANDLTRFFNLHNGPRSFQTINSPLGAKFFINDRRQPTDPDDD
jgi:phospholipase C